MSDEGLETITADGFPAPTPKVLDHCVDCGGDILSGDPVTVTSDGLRWHAECRTVAIRKAAKPTPSRRARGQDASLND